MFPDHRPERGAIASQLLACLDGYALEMARLEQSRWDPELYATSTRTFEQMKRHAGALPELSGCWIELLISRFEFSAHLWSQHVAPARGSAPLLHERHMVAIRALRGKTQALLPAPR